MDLKNFDIKKLDQKQKIMLPVAAVLVLVVIWQVFSLFGGSNQDYSAPVASAPGQFTNVADNQGAPGSGGVQEVVTTSVKEVPPQPPTQQDMNDLATSQQVRRVYLGLLQQYQIATVQRLLSEVRANIAASEANYAKQNLDKIRAEEQVKQLSSGAAMVGPGGQLMTGMIQPTNVDDSQIGPSERFMLSYIGQRAGRWSAILMYDGQPYDVTVGSRLPDESEVMSINSDSVLIARNMKRLLLTMPTTSKSLLKKPAPVQADGQIPTSS